MSAPRRKKIVRWIIGIILGIMLLPFLLLLALQLPVVQDFVRSKAESYLRNQLKTEVQVGGLRFSWWNSVTLQKVFVSDLRKDTLLYSGELSAQFNLLALTRNELNIRSVEWEDAVIHVYRPAADSSFNYQFAIDAFVDPSAKSDTLIEETGTMLQYNIGKVALQRIDIRFNDSLGGMLASVQLKELMLEPDVLKPENGTYHLDELKLDGLQASVLQQYRPSVAVGTDTAGTPLDLSAVKLDITNTQWSYTDEASGLSTTGMIGALSLRKAQLDLVGTLVSAEELSLLKSKAGLEFRKAMDTVVVTEDTAPNTWKVHAKRLRVNGVDFAMTNHEAPRQPYKEAVDYNHLDMKGLQLEADDLSYSPDSTTVKILSGAVLEQSGLQLKRLKGNVRYTTQEVELDDFLLQTAESSIDADVRLRTASWSTVSDQLGLLQVDADIRPSTLALKEALFFVPDMRHDTMLQPVWKKYVSLHGSVAGTLANLRIPGIEMKDSDQNYVYVKGAVYHVTDPDRIGADLANIKLRSSDRGIRSWLPAGTLSPSMQLPHRLHVDGSIRGGMQVLRPDLIVTTDLGNASLKGELASFTDMKKIRYDVALHTQGLQVGRILGDTTMGNLTAALSAKGRGAEPETATASANINIISFNYNRYEYTDIKVDADLHNGAYKAKGGMEDSNVVVRFDVSGKVDSLHPAIVAKADLERFDLMATHFTTEPMLIRSCLEAQLDNLSPRRLTGFAAIHKLQIVDARSMYVLDSIMLTAGVEEGLQQLRLTGPFGYLRVSGDFNYQTFATAAQEMVTRHMEAAATGMAAVKPKPRHAERHWLEFNGSLQIPKSLKELLPGIRMEKPLTLDGRMNTDSSLIIANLQLPHLLYDSFKVDTFMVRMKADSAQVQANVRLRQLYHPDIPLERIRLSAKAKQGTVDWDLYMGDIGERPKYKLGGLVQFLQNDSMLISLKEDLRLNRQQWSVRGDNKLMIQGGGVAFADIGISRSGQELHLQTTGERGTAALPDLNVRIKDFELSTITSFIEKDTALAEGTANGNITISEMDRSPLIDGQLTIDSLAAMGAGIGQLRLKANTTADETVNIDAVIQGNDNDLRLQGTYADVMNFRIDIARLNMKSAEAFTFGNVTDMSGYMSGNVTFRGTLDEPELRGKLHFEKAAGRVTAINNYLQLPSEDIIMDESGLRLNQFVIADSSGNEAVINGRVATEDYSEYKLDLTLRAQNFMALGRKSNDPEQLFYGPAYIDVNARIRGTQNLPRVEMNLKLREKSEVTVTVPEEDPGIASREGVVEFIDPETMYNPALRLRDTVKIGTVGIKGFVFSGDIEVTPASTLRIIIDKVNGDFLEVKGNATLNLTMDPSSKMSLTGRYEINEGKYAMSLNQLIKREFRIVKGSTIIWNGDPLSATVNITAQYDVNAVAADLVQDQIQSSDPTSRRFNQKVPVEVFLKITGELLKPEIAFELDMPEKDQGALDGLVYTRIKQINQVPSELNKQVMGLLVLNRFISENPFESLNSGEGNLAEDVARRSVSKLISQQLNNLAGSLVKGFDVNFDLQSGNEYTDAGTREESTSLAIGVSKRLFSDRLTVSVGSNIGLSGQQTKGQDASSIIGDVSAEYTLTPDGRYRVRAYRRNLTETIVQGQIVETGLSFMLIMDYNEFREIFKKTEKEVRQERIRK